MLFNSPSDIRDVSEAIRDAVAHVFVNWHRLHFGRVG